jgi:hypothetical protein
LGVLGGTNLSGYDGVVTRDADPFGLACTTREQRWLQLANDPNTTLPKEVVDHINRHGGRGVSQRFGLELAHLPGRAAAQGHDYAQAIPKFAADHRGIQHRYLQERSTGTTVKIPANKRSGRKLDLPPEGSLPG